jgi:hypothetical protein
VADLEELAAKVRADIADGEQIAERYNVELGPHDEVRHEHLLALLAVADAAAQLPDLAAELESDAACQDPAGTKALQLNSRARGLRDATDHITQSLTSAGADDA